MSDVQSTALSGLSMEVLDSAEAFRGLQEDWSRLLATSRRPSPFLAWEWLYTWWESYGAAGGRRSLRLLLAREPEGAPAAILPLYLETGRAGPFRDFRRLRFLGFPHESSEYLDLIGDGSAAAVEGLLELARGSGADVLELTDLLPDSLLLAGLRRWAAAARPVVREWPRNRCPYLPLEADFEACLEGLSSSVRYGFRRRSRGLEKRGELVLRRVSGEDEAAAALEALFELHRRRFRSKGARSGFDQPARLQFHRRFVPRALQAGLLRFYLLELDGRTLAALYCFGQGRTVYHYQAGLDPDWEPFSPGLVLLGRAIQASIGEGMVEFDFLRGLERYKLQWTDRCLQTLLLEVGLTPRGKALVAARALWRRGTALVKRTLKRPLKRPLKLLRREEP